LRKPAFAEHQLDAVVAKDGSRAMGTLSAAIAQKLLTIFYSDMNFGHGCTQTAAQVESLGA
jgi:hypothetical protein